MKAKKFITVLSVVALNLQLPLQINAAEQAVENSVSVSEAVQNSETEESKVTNSSEAETQEQTVESTESTGSSDSKSQSEKSTEKDSLSEEVKDNTATTSESKSQKVDNSATTETSENKKQVKAAAEVGTGTVNVKCVTEDGMVIHTETLTGAIGDSYTANHYGHYYGWVVNERPDNYKGVYTSEPQTVTFVYTSAPVKRFNVKYIDMDSGKEIASSTAVYGIADAPYTTEAKTIDGYTLVKDSGNTSGTLPALYPSGGVAGTAGTIVYYYQGNGAAEPVTVNYIDKDGNQLAEPDTLTGQIGAKYESNQKNIEGWALSETPKNSKGTFTDKKQTVAYVYEKADAAPVTVKFVNTNGESIFDDVILSGKLGSKYTTSPVRIETEPNIRPSWLLKTTPENATGEFSDTPQTVTYVYGKAIEIFPWVKNAKDGNLTINFGPSQYVVEGEEYSVELPEKPGWRLVGSDVPLTGIAEKDIDIELYYEMYTPTVTVKFVDTDGNELSKEESIEGKYGFPYETSAKNIDGWSLKETPANATGALDQESQTVTYVYEKATAAPVTVKYEDKDGNELAAPDTLNGQVGDAYETSAKAIAGWTVTETPANAQGTFGEKAQTVTYVYEKATAAPVTVKYEDKDGNELAAPDTLNGQVGDAYETSAKAIAGWTVTETPANAQGTFGEKAQTVTYVYEKATAAPVTVKYEDKDGNELATPDTLNGQVGDAYETSAKAIAGWTVTETPANAQGTFGEKAQTVTYVYEKATAAPVTVKYEDKDGNELAAPDTLNGQVGDAYETSAKAIAGWTVTETPANAQGTFGEKAQTVTYVYEKATAAPVTVKYEDKDGNELATPDTLNGQVGDAYETSAKAIAGWALTEIPENAQGVFSDTAQTVTYVYEKATAAPVTVKYEDKDGNELATPDTLNGQVGDAYETSAKAIAGWAVTGTPANAQGTFGEKAQTVTYVYEKATAAPVTVKYEDKDGNELATPDTLNGQVGDAYETSAKAIAGWALTEIPENAQGVFSDTAQTVTYVYEKAAEGTIQVIVQYLDEEGNEISDPTILTGKLGETYTVKAKVISGYELVSASDTLEGTFGARSVNPSFIYRKVASDVPTPAKDKDNPTDPKSDPTNPKDKLATDKTTDSTSKKLTVIDPKDSKKSLPKTGETTTPWLSIVGGSGVLVALLAFFKNKKK
jgi:LPXTG-motif cell wall-anchored protein